MKTLKKVLSLVLVVAMIASMLIVGAAAAEETKYPEAAAVVSALGIIEGDEGGMRYGDNVTREQAAKIIAYMLLGKNTADALKTNAAPFADVAANRWSAGYVAYLKNQGIISGVSATEFDPTAPVTGVAFAKMLLTAVGYGQNGEFEGAAWDINTISLANQLGLYTGTVAADLTAAATREEAMLYAFNTLSGIDTVKYNKTFEAYYVGTSPLDTTANGKTLGEQNFKLTKGVAGTDVFGRPATSWLVDGIAVVTGTATEAPTATLSNVVTYAALYNTLGKTVVAGIDTAASTLVVNGALKTFPALNAYSAYDYVTAISGLGDNVELYVTYLGAGKYDVDIVIYNETITTVNRVDKATYTAYLANGKTVSGYVLDITGLAKGDHVLVTEAAGAVQSIKEVAPVSGIYTAYNPNYSTIVVDGITYSSRVAYPTAAAEMNISYDLYLDSLGNVVKMTLTPASQISTYDYVYVAAAAAQIIEGDLLTAASTKVVVQVIYPNGGSAVVDYAILTDAYYEQYITVNGKNVYLSEGVPAIEAAITTGWHTYTMNEVGEITLGALNADYAAVVPTLTVTGGYAKITGTTKTATVATTLTTVSPVRYGAVATVKTGFAAFPTSETYTNALITYDKGAVTVNTISVVDVIGSTPAPVYAYCAAVGNTGAAGTTYTVVFLDGTVENIVSTGVMTKGSVYTVAANAYGTYNVGSATGIVNDGAAFDIYGQAVPQATIATVGSNYFTSTATSYADGDAADIDAVTYYYDAYTVVVDCTGTGATLAEGSVFLAATTTASSGSYAGLNYCTYIWIVG